VGQICTEAAVDYSESMAVDAGPGPERESVKLLQWEADAFMIIVEHNTFDAPRFQLSYALRQVRNPMSAFVVNGFQQNARKMWRTIPPAIGP
jgi:hypothetical protein